MDPTYDDSPETELPSCSGCRKRKLKCSRQKPACSNCERLQTTCVYEARRNKPGLKSGAVESLSQRLEKVERALFGQGHGQEGDDLVESEPHRADIPSPLEKVLSTLAGELQKLNQNITPTSSRSDQSQDAHGSRKRRRAERPQAEELLNDTPEDLPSSFDGDGIYDILDDLLDAYFSHIQPWIPMINMRDFRARARRDNDHTLKVVLQAMAVACLRYVERDGELLPTDYVRTETRRLRRLVLLDALDGLTVENLQALTMIAFTDIGDGNLDKAWPIIGSLTRTVEYMELSVETEDRQQRPAVLPSPSCLSPPLEWVEEEERRRVFWNIFILDRFSSVVKGLPICGGRWFEDDPAVTPYFGIWDRSRARIGNSITFLPGHYPSPSHSAAGENADPELQGPPSRGQGSSNTVDMSMVGAFAYHVESIESLSQITTYFLQTKIDFTNRQEVSNWLTRFKELDLRLVHWKMYLPQQWKDSGVSREMMPGVMDPNMTVANATHNISLILLHQRIAYPDAELGGIRLPSLCSADTCYTAAIETANITTKYLEGASHKWPVSPQLGICAFSLTGSVHSRYYKSALADDFQVLVENLKEMSRRWSGYSNPESSSFFSQLSDCLINLCNEPQEMQVQGAASKSSHASREISGSTVQPLTGPQTSYPTISCPPVVNAMSGLLGQDNEQWQSTADSLHPQSNARDDLSAISQMLMNNDFLEMDRIISFEDMMSGELPHTAL
ncbi:hypothetical protein FDECE_6529 [Fusarium decemcellulare]|nr:hypothetical protein FDECE_6529 [Fusarium decemcellulare]